MKLTKNKITEFLNVMIRLLVFCLFVILIWLFFSHVDTKLLWAIVLTFVVLILCVLMPILLAIILAIIAIITGLIRSIPKHIRTSAICLSCGGSLKKVEIPVNEDNEHVRGAGTPVSIYSALECQKCGVVTRGEFLRTDWWY